MARRSVSAPCTSDEMGHSAPASATERLKLILPPNLGVLAWSRRICFQSEAWELLSNRIRASRAEVSGSRRFLSERSPFKPKSTVSSQSLTFLPMLSRTAVMLEVEFSGRLPALCSMVLACPSPDHVGAHQREGERDQG